MTHLLAIYSIRIISDALPENIAGDDASTEIWDAVADADNVNSVQFGSIGIVPQVFEQGQVQQEVPQVQEDLLVQSVPRLLNSTVEFLREEIIFQRQ